MPDKHKAAAFKDSTVVRGSAHPQIHLPAPQGMAGVISIFLRCAPPVFAKGIISSNQSGDCPARSARQAPKAKPQSLPKQRDLRRALSETDFVNCMVALPGQRFYSTQIAVCL